VDPHLAIPSPRGSDAGEAAAAAATGDGGGGEVRGDEDRGGAVAALGLSHGLRRAGRAPAPRIRGPSQGSPGARCLRRAARVSPPSRVSLSPPIMHHRCATDCHILSDY